MSILQAPTVLFSSLKTEKKNYLLPYLILVHRALTKERKSKPLVYSILSLIFLSFFSLIDFYIYNIYIPIYLFPSRLFFSIEGNKKKRKATYPNKKEKPLLLPLERNPLGKKKENREEEKRKKKKKKKTRLFALPCPMPYALCPMPCPAPCQQPNPPRGKRSA